MLKIVSSTLKPSENVFSFEKLPFGLSRYAIGTSTIGMRLSSAKSVISVSISNPPERMGQFLTKSRLNAL